MRHERKALHHQMSLLSKNSKNILRSSFTPYCFICSLLARLSSCGLFVFPGGRRQKNQRFPKLSALKCRTQSIYYRVYPRVCQCVLLPALRIGSCSWLEAVARVSCSTISLKYRGLSAQCILIFLLDSVVHIAAPLHGSRLIKTGAIDRDLLVFVSHIAAENSSSAPSSPSSR